MLATEHVVAFLDARPVFKGHVLLVPREHVVTLPDLPAGAARPVPRGRPAARARRWSTGLGAQGSFVAMNNTVSQSVAHLHLHVVPRTKGDGLRGFFWPRTKYASDTERAGFGDRLRAALGHGLTRGPYLGWAGPTDARRWAAASRCSILGQPRSWLPVPSAAIQTPAAPRTAPPRVSTK